MKKTLLSCLAAVALLFTGSVQAFALNEVDGVYQISSIDDLLDFGDIVNTGEDPAANAVLTCDLTFGKSDTYYPIGVVGNPYTGTFDGQGHKLIDINIDSGNLDYEDYIGVFGVLGGGAHIKNLFVTGKDAFIAGKAFVAGIAGGTNGNGIVTIENCGNEATVFAEKQNAAGILGVDMESKADVSIINCYNTGEIFGEKESAAICGWIGDHGVCKGCWNTYDFAGSNGCDLGRPFCRFNGCDFDNCWDVQDVQSGIGTITEDMLAGMETGEFCYKVLNQTLTEDVAWFQAIGTDEHPFPVASHGIVYAVGDLNCDGTSKSGETTYSNSNSSNRDPHTFVDGFCSACGEWHADYMTADADGYFNLAKAADLVWYAHYMNMKENEQKNARLTADIDMAGVEWTPISNSDATRFKATFDGQEHTIANFNVVSTGERIALFANVTGGAVIKNVKVTGSFEAVAKVAGIIGFADGGETVTLENVINAADVHSTGSTDANAAGLVACAVNNTKINAISCANLGNISGQDGQCGAFSGWSQGGTTWNNCWNDGTITNMEGERNLFRGSADAIDCFDTSATEKKSQGTDATEADKASGELCYKYLNAAATTNVGWFQTLGTDALPVPFASHGIVYVAGAQTCDGSPKPGASEGYSNNASGNRDPHAFDHGFCTVCHAVDMAYKTPEADGYIAIADENDFKWFMAYTKTQETRTAKGKMTADIKYTGQETFSAERCNFAGAFNGQEHTLTVNLEGEKNVAIFKNIEGATIENLVIDGEVYSDGQFAAGLVAESWGPTVIKNVIVKAEITSAHSGDGTHGGFVAVGHDDLLIENCAFVGVLEAPNSSGSGAIMGWTHGASSTIIKNCYVAGEIVLLEGENNTTICRNNPTIENCWVSYDISQYDIPEGVELFEPTEEMVSGELCYYLGNKAWFQTIGTDKYPVPFASHKTVYAHGDYKCDGTPNGDITYSNEEGAINYAEHNFVNGVCDSCHNAFQVGTADELIDIAYDIEGGDKTDATIILTADIDTEGTDFIPLGSRMEDGAGYNFTGTFDGQGHTVNLALVGGNNVGLIGVAGDGAVVKNVIVTGTVVATGYAAGIIGATQGTGKVRIENCGNEADVTADGPNAAGILGVDDGSAMQVTILNCYNTGTIVGGSESAAISGWLGEKCSVINTWSSGDVTGADNNKTTFFRSSNGRAKAINCYETFGEQVTKVTAEQVANGDLCRMLNQGAGEEIWFQTIGSDKHPVLDSTHESGIENIITVVSGAEGIYTISGAKVNTIQKGINIIKMTDGSVRKVLVK